MSTSTGKPPVPYARGLQGSLRRRVPSAVGRQCPQGHHPLLRRERPMHRSRGLSSWAPPIVSYPSSTRPLDRSAEDSVALTASGKSARHSHLTGSQRTSSRSWPLAVPHGTGYLDHVAAGSESMRRALLTMSTIPMRQWFRQSQHETILRRSLRWGVLKAALVFTDPRGHDRVQSGEPPHYQPVGWPQITTPDVPER